MHDKRTRGGLNFACGRLGAGSMASLVGLRGPLRSRLIEALYTGKGLSEVGASRDGFWVAAESRLPRFRGTLQGWAKGLLGARDPAELVHALTALGLWESRAASRARLSDGEQRLAATLPALLSDADGIVLVEGVFAGLDLVAKSRFLTLLEARAAEGVLVVIETDDWGVAEQCDSLVVIGREGVLFCGKTSSLMDRAVEEVRIATPREAAVRAMVDPFSVSVEVHRGEVRAWAPAGQDLAAKLLALGYGDVEFVVVRPAQLREAVLAMLGGASSQSC